MLRRRRVWCLAIRGQQRAARVCRMLPIRAVDFERRDFVVDPVESLSPGGNNAYPEGNVLVRTREEGPEGAPIVGAEIRDIKWPQSAIDAIK